MAYEELFTDLLKAEREEDVTDALTVFGLEKFSDSLPDRVFLRVPQVSRFSRPGRVPRLTGSALLTSAAATAPLVQGPISRGN
jgi:hypothetical protein